MTEPAPQSSASSATSATSATSDSERTPLFHTAIWVAIGSLVAAALVCVVWVLVGSSDGIVGRAFLTILLLAAFAGVTILEVHLAERRPLWFSLVSMSSWILTLLIGAFMIWMPQPAFADFFGSGFTRTTSFLLIVLIIQLAVLHVRLYSKAFLHQATTFSRVVGYATVGLVAVLTFMLVLPLMLNEWVNFYDFYWRLLVAFAILAAVGTALVPLVNVLFAPRKPRPAPAAAPVPPVAPVSAPASAVWPTYIDGATPLPMMPDRSPDWNAYYTGVPSLGAVYPHGVTFAAPVAAEPAPSADSEPVEPVVSEAETAGYDGFPPPPPLPPRD